MKIIDIINNRKKTLISLEITPPEKGHSMESVFEAVDLLSPYQPAFINVTYHQQHLVYEETESGIVKIPRRKKPGTIGICAALLKKYKIETAPHLICGGSSKYEIEDTLIDLNYMGFENLFIIRGDPPSSLKEFKIEPDGHQYASQLVEQIADLNKAKYLENLLDVKPTKFCIGVAGYPEKHHEAPNIFEDIKYLKEKVNKGASYIITQMVFSLQAFKNFVELCRANGINVPIIPGVKVLTNTKQLISVPRDFHLNLPEELVNAMSKAESPELARQAGIDFTISYCKQLIEFGAPCLHFYTMGKGIVVAEVLEGLRKQNLI